MFELQVRNEKIELYYETTFPSLIYYGVWVKKYQLTITNVKQDGKEWKYLDSGRNYSVGGLK